MEQLTQEDIKNTIALISIAPIKGNESFTVALILQKLQKMLTVPEEPKETKKE